MSGMAIAMRGVRKRYPGGRTGLDGVDLEVDTGRFFGLLGPNGAGKTTLIGTLTTLVRPDVGHIRVFDHPVHRDAVAAKECMGIVPQEVNFNSFEPVGEIVESQAAYYGLSPRRARERSQAILQRTGLADRARQTAWGLSGGLKRRLMIARALVHSPRLLVLDEPTAGVDLEARHATWELMRELNADGVTILLTTHYLEEAEALCGELAFIDQGRIVTRGETGALLRGMEQQTVVLELAAPAPEGFDTLAQDGLALRRVDDWTLEAELPTGADLNQLFDRLETTGIRVAGLRYRQNRLESLFLQQVGHTGETACD